MRRVAMILFVMGLTKNLFMRTLSRKLVLLFSALSCSLVAQTPLAEPLQTVMRPLLRPDLSNLVSGDTGFIAYAEPDGSRTIVGGISKLHEGIEYRNHLRFKPDGSLDTATRFSAEYANEFTDFVGSSDAGERVFRSRAGVEGSNSRFYVSSIGNTASRPLNIKPDPGGQTDIATVTGDGWLYYVHFAQSGQRSVRRMRLKTGGTDTQWKQDFVFPWDYVADLQVDSYGGLWVLSAASNTFTGQSGLIEWTRYRIASPGANGQTIALNEPTQNFFTKPLLLTATHAYVFGARYALTDVLVKDSGWNPKEAPAYVDNRHAYFVNRVVGLGMPQQDFITRAAITSNGSIDTGWKRSVPIGIDLTGNMWRTDAGALEVRGTIVNAYDVILSDAQPPAREKNVTEYYSPAFDRYFITGRDDEKKLLDTFPNFWTRTQASFSALDSTFRDGDGAPVCRYYNAQSRGGSNSHFYGTGNDCKGLNQFNTFANEGYDFAAVLPISGKCPANYSTPITRVFNNKVATKNGNHRYVTNAADKALMLTRGWVDEGIAFCAVSATAASK